jgi:hypothetical protein
MGKHCDLGHVVDPSCRGDLDQLLEDVPPTETVLSLELEIKPTTYSHLLPPAVYRLHLRVGAANARPVTAVVELNCTGKWFADSQRMFSEGLGVKVI